MKSYLNALKHEPDNLQILKDLAALQIQIREVKVCRVKKYNGVVFFLSYDAHDNEQNIQCISYCAVGNVGNGGGGGGVLSRRRRYYAAFCGWAEVLFIIVGFVRVLRYGVRIYVFYGYLCKKMLNVMLRFVGRREYCLVVFVHVCRTDYVSLYKRC